MYVVIIIGALILLWLILYLIPIGLWFQALVSGVRISLLQLIFMRWRKVPPSIIVGAMIEGWKAGLELNRDDLEAHFLAGGHVRMDIIYSRWSTRRKALMDAGLFVFFVIFVGLTLWSSTEHAITSTMMMQRSGTTWHPYLWPIKIIVAIGFLLMLLQGISQFIKSIATARGKPLP